MKHVSLIIAMVGLLSSFSVHSFTVEKKHTKKFFAQSMVAVVLSCSIGAITGEAIRCIEKELIKELAIEKSPIALFLYLLSWSLESGLRNALVASLQKDLEDYGVGNRGYLMFRVAQLASWAMYLREHIQNKGKALGYNIGYNNRGYIWPLNEIFTGNKFF